VHYLRSRRGTAGDRLQHGTALAFNEIKAAAGVEVIGVIERERTPPQRLAESGM